MLLCATTATLDMVSSPMDSVEVCQEKMFVLCLEISHFDLINYNKSLASFILLIEHMNKTQNIELTLTVSVATIDALQHFETG